MMMSATRNSFRSKKSSPKNKKRSRRVVNEEDSVQHNRPPSQRNPAESNRPASYPRPYSGESRETAKHVDVPDSGIDSGNGTAEHESPQNRLHDSSSQDYKPRNVPEQGHSTSPNREHHHSEQSSVVPKTASPAGRKCSQTGSGSSDVPPSSRRSSKSRHRKRAPSESDEGASESSMTEEPTVPKPKDKERSGANRKSPSDKAVRAGDNLSPPVVSGKSAHSSVSWSDLKDSSSGSNEKGHQPSMTDREEERNGSRGDGSLSGTQGGEGEASSPPVADAVTLSPEAMEQKRKLLSRLEQAKHSLASPHVTAAVEAYDWVSAHKDDTRWMLQSQRIIPTRRRGHGLRAIELPDATMEGIPDVSLLHEFRRLFQLELIRLRVELDTFRRFCAKQMEREAKNVFPEEKHSALPPDNEKAAHDKMEISEQSGETTKGEEPEREVKKVKDVETLEKWEEQLAARQKDLHDYEKEILEVETMLNQRQAICERRQSALLALDEELQSLREDIFDKKENLKSDTDTNVERARKNWDFVRRHLTDKQAMLEATIQRYRTQIASANASMAAKDTLIAHLQKQLKETQEKLQTREKKVEQLENKLVFATEEMHVLQAMKDAPSSLPADSDPLSQSQTGRSSTFRPTSSLIRRQVSEASSSDRATSRRGSVMKSSTTSGSGQQQQRGRSPDQDVGQRAVSAPPGRDRRLSTIRRPEEILNQGKSSNSNSTLEREQSLKRRDRRRSRSTASSIANSATNASAACTIL